MAEATPKINVNKKFNTTLIIVFVLIVLIVGYFMYEKYQAKKLQEAQAEEEMKKLKESKEAEKKEEENKGENKKEKTGDKTGEKSKQSTQVKTETKKEEITVPVEEVTQPVLLVEENPTLNEPIKDNQESSLNSGNAKTEPLIIEETESHFIGKDVFVSNRDIRVFSEPNTKSVAIAQFKSTPNGNKLFIGKIERVFFISEVRWFYIKIGSMSEGVKKGYVKERFVDVKIEA